MSPTLIFILLSSLANADTEIVLQKGQCAQVDGNSYCWYYRASNLNAPHLPPRPCDFRKDCPLTLLVPTTHTSPNIISAPMKERLATPRTVPSAMVFCRERSEDDFVLVLVEVKDGKKTETVLNEYKDDDDKCEEDEERYGTHSMAVQSVKVVDPMADVPEPVTGPVVVDPTSGRQAQCPQTQQYKTEVKKIPAKKLLKKLF